MSAHRGKREGIWLETQAELAETGLLLHCTVENLCPTPVYVLCLELASGEPACRIRFVTDAGDPARSWVQLYSGGLGDTGNKIPAFRARNAGELLVPGASVVLTFGLPDPVDEPDLLVMPEKPALARAAQQLLVKLECALDPAGGARPAPVRGFDLPGAATFVVESWLALPRPLVVRSAAPDGEAA